MQSICSICHSLFPVSCSSLTKLHSFLHYANITRDQSWSKTTLRELFTANIASAISEPFVRQRFFNITMASSVATHTSAPPRFFDFPAEIRNQIYRCLVRPATYLSISSKASKPGSCYCYLDYSRKVATEHIYARILLTSHQVFTEAASILYGSHGFAFEDPSLFENFARSTRPSNAALMNVAYISTWL